MSRKVSLGVDILTVIAEAAPGACTSSYKAMETIDRFAWQMQNQPGVSRVMTLQAAAKIEVHPEFKLSLVASEPLVNKVMNIDWDERGRLWVREKPE